MAASADGKWLALGGTDHFTRLWDVRGRPCGPRLEATKPPVGSVAFSADGRLLAHTSPADGLVWIWDADTLEPQADPDRGGRRLHPGDRRLPPDGHSVACGGADYLATGDRDGAACVWDLATKEKRMAFDVGVYVARLRRHRQVPGRGGPRRHRLRLGHRTQELVFELEGHQQKVNVVTFSPDGSYLLAGGDDMTVRVWDVLSGRLLVAREFDSAGAVAGLRAGRAIPVRRQRQHDLLPDRVQEDAGRLSPDPTTYREAMKKFFGYLCGGLGAAAALWGAYHVATGQSNKILFDSIKAMYLGLAGLAFLVLGFVWIRD